MDVTVDGYEPGRLALVASHVAPTAAGAACEADA
jgi:hypothetical protein